MGWIFDGAYIEENDLIEGDEIIEIVGEDDFPEDLEDDE